MAIGMQFVAKYPTTLKELETLCWQARRYGLTDDAPVVKPSIFEPGVTILAVDELGKKAKS